jgi:hypothetical protein
MFPENVDVVGVAATGVLETVTGLFPMELPLNNTFSERLPEMPGGRVAA